MTADAFARAREAAIDRLVRERFGLPTIASWQFAVDGRRSQPA